jgi:hypothetical protein
MIVATMLATMLAMRLAMILGSVSGAIKVFLISAALTRETNRELSDDEAAETRTVSSYGRSREGIAGPLPAAT